MEVSGWKMANRILVIHWGFGGRSEWWDIKCVIKSDIQGHPGLHDFILFYFILTCEVKGNSWNPKHFSPVFAVVHFYSLFSFQLFWGSSLWPLDTNTCPQILRVLSQCYFLILLLFPWKPLPKKFSLAIILNFNHSSL